MIYEIFPNRFIEAFKPNSTIQSKGLNRIRMCNTFNEWSSNNSTINPTLNRSSIPVAVPIIMTHSIHGLHIAPQTETCGQSAMVDQYTSQRIDYTNFPNHQGKPSIMKGDFYIKFL